MKRMPFSTWSVLGILAGRKTQTRRVMKPQPPEDWVPGKVLVADTVGEDFTFYGQWAHEGHDERGVFRQRYHGGEVVAMSEALVRISGDSQACTQPAVAYAADEKMAWRPMADDLNPGQTVLTEVAWDWERDKLPSIHMPTWAARRWLRITDVRAERMLDISEEDALAEGLICDPQPHGDEKVWYDWQASDGVWYPDHLSAWAATIRAHNPKMQPDDNPWLFAYTLEQVDKPEGENP